MLKKRSATSKPSGDCSESKNVHFTDELIGVRDIRGGLIITTEGKYIKILEVLPTNFMQKSEADKEWIIYKFQSIFRLIPGRVKFKTMTSTADVDNIAANVREHCMKLGSEKINIAADDYLKTIYSLRNQTGIVRHYYIIFEYDNDVDDEYAYDFNKIYTKMTDIEFQIRSMLRECGNEVVYHTNENNFLFEFLFKYYNRLSYHKEDYTTRLLRMNYDAEMYSKSVGQTKEYSIASYISPRGIDTTFHDMILMDGIYYSYVCIRDNGYFNYVNGGWLDVFNMGVGIDIDVCCKKQPHDITMKIIEQKKRIHTDTVNANPYNPDKQAAAMASAMNSKYILDRMAQGEDLYKVVTIFTFWSEDPNYVRRARTAILGKLKVLEMSGEKSHNDCLAYFKTVSPLLTYSNSLFNRNGHDFLSSSLSAFYNYSSFTMFDEKGIIIGSNQQNGSIFSINNFNSSLFKNANMAFIGTSGAGKTYLEQLFSRRSLLIGHNEYFVLPVKGYEYRKAVQSMGGVYAQLFPGSPVCVNIMAIIPEKQVDEDEFEDDDDLMYTQQSLLAKKIASLMTWIQLRMGIDRMKSTERSLLGKLLTDTYADFGITDDNDSIYESDGSLKVMPTLDHLYAKAAIYPETYQYILDILEDFVHGQFRNFVGQTNIDLTNPMIAFDVDERVVGKEDLPSILYIAFDISYTLATSNEGFTNVILDEVWKMMVNEACAEQVNYMSKLIRGYGGALITATQELEDFMTKGGGTVLKNSSTKIVLGLTDEEIKFVADEIDISPDDAAMIKSFQRGQALFLSNGLRIPITIQGSDLETSIFTTDKRVKQKLKEARKV